MKLLQALKAIVARELFKFLRQYGRLASALVRPLLWLAVFAAGFRSVFGVAIVEPYETYISYDVYIVPGLVGMVLLFNGMQSSLAMVYDREMGLMRLLLTAPLPRWWVLACKLPSLAGRAYFAYFAGNDLRCPNARCTRPAAECAHQAT
jgi:ABC-2 type transport system permease protein